MKIAVDVLSIREDGSAGGATGFALELIKGFAKTSGVQVMVLCADWNIELLKKCLPNNIQFCQVVGDFRYTGIGRVDRRINQVVRKLRSGSVLAKNHVDVLFCPFSAATYKEKGIPTVSTILDIQHEFYPQFFEPQELRHRRKFYQDIVKKVERVVCISDYTKETFCDKYNYPLDRAQTIYIAIQNRFDKEDDRILDKLDIRNQKYIVYPANFWEHKNHKLLLNAFAMYAKNHRDMKLVLTGNPLTQTDYYRNLLKTMKIDDLTVITGYVTNEELYSILKNSNGLIYPSLFEGFGIPVVEAMHMHKLISCSNLTSLPEIGCDAICYFNPKKPDEILRGIDYLAENQITDDIIAEYDTKLKEYENDKMVREYMEVFHNVIDQKDNLLFQEEVSGIYPDGWSSRGIVLQLKQKAGGKVRAKFNLPEFVDTKLKLVITHNGVAKTVWINPGETVNLMEELVEEKTELYIKCLKTWSPKTVLKSEDARELGVMVESLELVTAEGEMIDLKDKG